MAGSAAWKVALLGAACFGAGAIFGWSLAEPRAPTDAPSPAPETPAAAVLAAPPSAPSSSAGSGPAAPAARAEGDPAAAPSESSSVAEGARPVATAAAPRAAAKPAVGPAATGRPKPPAIPAGQGGLQLSVTLADGTTPKGAVVRFRRGGETISRHWSPERPMAHAPPGEYEVTVESGSSSEWVSDPQVVAISEGGEVPALSPRLRGKPGIRGSVQFEDGEASGGMTVYAARIAEGQKAEPAHLGVIAGAVSGQGRYTFFLDPGRYAIGVSIRTQFEILAVDAVDVVDRLVEFDLRVPPLADAVRVPVRVLAPDGGLERDAQIEVQCEKGAQRGFQILRTDGILLGYHGLHEVAAGSAPCRVSARSMKYGTREVPLPKLPVDEVVVKFDAPADLEVNLVGFDAERYLGKVRIGLRAPDRKPLDPFVPQPADSRGRRTFLGIQPGEYEVRVTTGTDAQQHLVARASVTVGSGKIARSVALPGLHDVEVEGVEGSTTLERTDDASWRISRKASGGRIAYSLLPDGEYRVTCGGRSKLFHLPGVETVQF